MLLAGAKGYILKITALKKLAEAISIIIEGGTFLDLN